MSVAAAVVVAVLALLVGVAIGYVIARSKLSAQTPEHSGPTVAELVLRLIRSSHNGVAVLNRFGDTLLHNPRAAELGLVRDDRVEDRARIAAERALRTGQNVEVDLSPLKASGRQPEAVLGEAAPLGDGFTVIEAVDHSEAVRLEATRRDFVANVSHELKTPIGAMALLAEALLDAADDTEEVKRFSGKIMREANRLGRLVTELIALSRLQGAERLPDLAEVDVDAVVAEALGRVELASEDEDRITTDTDSGLKVDGDNMLLVTALSNLLTNALAYSPEGTPVTVSRKRVGDRIEISVTDRGIGIADEEQQRVFERFYRVDKARSRMTGGTGLGLAIVKHVAANHGGEVRLWSKPGTGSTFTMSLPAAGAKSARQQDAGPVAGANGSGRKVGSRPARLLVATGDPHQQGGRTT